MLSIKLFPAGTLLVMAIVTTTTIVGINLFVYTPYQFATGILESPQFSLSQPQLQQQNSTSITANDTIIFDLQSYLLNSIFNKVQNSIVQITSKTPITLSTSPYPNLPS